jgi:hypothetical protein
VNSGGNKSGAVHEFTALSSELADVKKRNAELEKRVLSYQTGAPLPVGPAVDVSAVLLELKDGKRKLDSFYTKMTASINAAISLLSGASVSISETPDMVSAAKPGLSDTAAAAVAAVAAAKTAAAAPKSPVDDLAGFANFTLDTPIMANNDSSDDLSAFTDFTIGGDTADLSSFTELTADVASASGSAVNEFKKNTTVFTSIDDALSSTLVSGTVYTPPKAAAVDDVFNDFGDLSALSAPTAAGGTPSGDDLSAFADFDMGGMSGGDDMSAFADFDIGGDGLETGGGLGDFESMMAKNAEDSKPGGDFDFVFPS